MLFCVVINIYTGWQKLLVWSLCNRCGCVDRFFMGSLHAFLYIFYFFCLDSPPAVVAGRGRDAHKIQLQI